AALLAGSAVATVATLARRNRHQTRDVYPVLELTPSHRAGTGTPLLLLHGISAIWRAWSPVLPYLEPHHDVIVPTLPGHAGGPPLDSQTAPSIEALTDSIEDELDRLDLQQVHIAGNSLGGWIGIELARRGRARSLVLFSPPGAWRSQRSIALRAAGVRRSVEALSRYSSRADAMAANALLRWLLLAGQVAHPSRIPPETLAAYIRASGAAPAVAPLLQAIPLRQVQPLPAVRDYPVRLVWGDRDRVLPFDGFGAPMLERLPGAELIRLKGVGHVPMSDDPVTVAKLILEVTRAVDNAVVSTEMGHRNA
ncbi:MAG: alpha/beta fold hydrolase, partial [Mycobacterium sp.]|nr:alpha/beta fold hydrolase [Mycobacterium sp.]